MRLIHRSLAALLLSSAPVWAQTGPIDAAPQPGAGSGAAAPAEATPPAAPKPAGAAPAAAPAGTAEGAKGIVDGLVPYFTRAAFDSNVLKVEPDPAGYRITIDPTVLIKGASAEGQQLQLPTYKMVVSRRDDGSWNVFSDSPLSFGGVIKQNGVEQTIDYKFDNPVFRGVYDPALAAFTSGTGSIDRIALTSLENGLGITASLGNSAYTITGTPAANGAVDMTGRQLIENFTETVTSKEAGDMTVTITGGKIAVDSSITAARARAIVDLYTFFIAHPEYFDTAPGAQGKLGATKEELRAKLTAALPLWDSARGAYVIDAMKIGGVFGSVTLDKVMVDASFGGVSASTGLDYRVGFEGLSLESALLPPWAGDLMPTAMEINFKIADIDLKTPADILIADLDPSKPEPVSNAAGERALATFAGKPVRFTVPKSFIRSRDADITVEGSVEVVNDKPSASFDIQAGGLDKLMDALREAAKSDPSVNQAIGSISLAKGFGKPLADGRTQWLIEAAADGSVKVNGNQVKGPDVPAVPDDATDGLVPDGQNLDGTAPVDPETPPTP